MLIHKDQDNIANYFAMQICSWAVGQHYTGNFFVQCWQNCISCFLAKICLHALGQHCASNFLMQCYLRHIWTILTWQYFYAILSQHGRYNIVWVIFLGKVVCLPWTNIAQVIFLCNVCLERSGHNWLFSSAKLFMDCTMIGGWNDRYTGCRQENFRGMFKDFFVCKWRFGVCLLLILHK